MDTSIIKVSEIKAKLVGLDPWFDAAAQSGAIYDDERFAEIIPQAVRKFERDVQFRVNQVRIRTFDDGTYGHGTEGIPVKDESAHPYYRSMGFEFMTDTMNHRPILQFDRMRFVLNEQTVVFTPPVDWVRYDIRTGRIWIMPVSGSAQVTGVMLGITQLQMMFGGKDYVPNCLAYDYVAGLPTGWHLTDEWADLKRVLTQACALEVLDDVSETFDAGLTAKTISGGEGLSQNLQYTRFQNRRSMLEKSIETFKATLRATETPFLLASL
jgi:hypothetical protein